MIVKELKLQLATIPDKVEVIFVSNRDDNILTDHYETTGTVYIEDQRDNTSFICIMPM